MLSNELLQKGVPARVQLPVRLVVFDLINICKNTHNLKQQIEIAGEKFYRLICDICDEETADFFKLKKLDVLEVFINEETLEKKLIVSTFHIFIKIAGLTNEIYRDYSSINNIIEELKSISEEQLQEKYPNLYKCYLSKKVDVAALAPTKAVLKKMNFFHVSERIRMLAKFHGCSYDMMKSKIDNATLSYDYRIFLDDFIHILNKLSKLFMFDTYNQAYSDIDIDIDEKDTEKLGIYITYLYQEFLKSVKEEYQQEYLYYISEYYFENKELINQNKKVYVPSIDKIISLKGMYEDYKRILANNPKLQIVDFRYDDFHGMNLFEVNEFMSEYFKCLCVNWEFFRDTKIDEETVLKILNYYGDSTKFSGQDELRDILNKFIEKKEFFDRTDPYYRILGKNSFDGYIGYIYSNGTVILEKFFENSSTGRVAKNQAIYIMNIQNFYTLTQLSKNKIISQKLCKRFIHKGNWQEKILLEINKDNDDNMITQINAYIAEGIMNRR